MRMGTRLPRSWVVWIPFVIGLVFIVQGVTFGNFDEEGVIRSVLLGGAPFVGVAIGRWRDRRAEEPRTEEHSRST